MGTISGTAWRDDWAEDVQINPAPRELLTPDELLSQEVKRLDDLWQEARTRAGIADELKNSTRELSDYPAKKAKFQEALTEWGRVWAIIDRLEKGGFEIEPHMEEIAGWAWSHHECTRYW